MALLAGGADRLRVSPAHLARDRADTGAHDTGPGRMVRLCATRHLHQLFIATPAIAIVPLALMDDAAVNALLPASVRARSRAILVVLLVLLLAAEAWIGLRSPLGTKHPRVYEGIAMRANDGNDMVLFDANDGTRAVFGADDTWWESESASGEGRAPCLKVPLRRSGVPGSAAAAGTPEDTPGRETALR